jgi:hypothetical protein
MGCAWRSTVRNVQVAAQQHRHQRMWTVSSIRPTPHTLSMGVCGQGQLKRKAGGYNNLSLLYLSFKIITYLGVVIDDDSLRSKLGI